MRLMNDYVEILECMGFELMLQHGDSLAPRTDIVLVARKRESLEGAAVPDEGGCVICDDAVVTSAKSSGVCCNALKELSLVLERSRCHRSLLEYVICLYMRRRGFAPSSV